MDEKTKYMNEHRSAYSYEFRAPFEGRPKDVDASFMWVPFEEEGYAMFLFKRKTDRDAFAKRYPELKKLAA